MVPLGASKSDSFPTDMPKFRAEISTFTAWCKQLWFQFTKFHTFTGNFTEMLNYFHLFESISWSLKRCEWVLGFVVLFIELLWDSWVALWLNWYIFLLSIFVFSVLSLVLPLRLPLVQCSLPLVFCRSCYVHSCAVFPQCACLPVWCQVWLPVSLFTVSCFILLVPCFLFLVHCT